MNVSAKAETVGRCAETPAPTAGPATAGTPPSSTPTPAAAGAPPSSTPTPAAAGAPPSSTPTPAAAPPPLASAPSAFAQLAGRRRRGAIRKRTLGGDEETGKEAGGVGPGPGAATGGAAAPAARPSATSAALSASREAATSAALAPSAKRPAFAVASTRRLVSADGSTSATGASLLSFQVAGGSSAASPAAAMRRAADEATRSLETETEREMDARGVLERARERTGAEGPDGGGLLGGGEYRGLAAYRDWRAGLAQRDGPSGASGAPAAAASRFGPIRATAHVRASVRIDYQPDVCKDYKETGYCGYGDACKFLHTREDTRASYQIEQEWEEQRAKEKEGQGRGDVGWAPDDDDEGGGGAAAGEAARPTVGARPGTFTVTGKATRGAAVDGKAAAGGKSASAVANAAADVSTSAAALPTACFGCRKRWSPAVTPVRLLCDHVICLDCASKGGARGACPVCGRATKGIFNAARDVARAAQRASMG